MAWHCGGSSVVITYSERRDSGRNANARSALGGGAGSDDFLLTKLCWDSRLGKEEGRGTGVEIGMNIGG